MSDQLLYQIALTLVPGVGDVNGKKLIAYCGGAEAVFKEKRSGLEKIPGIGKTTVKSIISNGVLSKAEDEIRYINKNNIQPLFYLDKNYPKRLQHCADSPMMLYFKGDTKFNDLRMVGVVGTRNASEYGKRMCEQLIEELAQDGVMIVSGLAYGIDTYAHRAALKFGLQTVGVLGHGLDRIYPDVNTNIAERMLQQGGLLTEFLSGTSPDRENFPKRNRIVAGMIDALIVVESAKRGGALITADIANSYNRDVFAFPGRIGDQYSEGCNFLIRTNRAALIENAANLRYLMGWEKESPKRGIQTKLFRAFTEEEQIVLSAFEGENECNIDALLMHTNLPSSKLAAVLLTLEFDGVLIALPGKRYHKP